MRRTTSTLLTLGWCFALGGGLAQAADKAVYRCPGNPVLYTDALTAKEARAKGCRNIEGTPITVIPGTKLRNTRAPPPSFRQPEAKVRRAEQRARDSDARTILEAELKKDEARLAALQAEYKNGEPERRGDERNYQKYLDRVAGLKADIARTESDVAAIKRELTKLSR